LWVHLDQTVQHDILLDFSLNPIGGTLQDFGWKVWPNLEFSRMVLPRLGCAGVVPRVIYIDIEKRQDILILDEVLTIVVFTAIVVGFQWLSSYFISEKIEK